MTFDGTPIDLGPEGTPVPEFTPPPAPPCVIYLNGGGKFEVTELDSWQWHDRGIFATGKWRGANEDEPEQDLLIPNEGIRYIKFDFSKTMPNG